MKKKLLLVGVAAMGLLAVGVGATSTFAWFASNQSFTAASVTGEKALQVGNNTYALGSFAVDVSITATADMTGMGLAHHTAKGAAGIPNSDDAVAPFLTTGYIDNVGTFHDLGYVESTGAPNLSTFTTAVTKLTTTVSFSIDVNWTKAWSSGVNGGWFQEAACSTPATGRGNATHYKDASGNIFAAGTVLTSLASDTVKVGVKPSAANATAKGARVIQAGGAPATAQAESGDPLLNSSCTILNTSYAQVNGAQSLTGIDSGSVSVTGTAIIYVWGGAGGTSQTADDEDVDASLQLYLE